MKTIGDELRERTFNYALEITRYCRALPESWDTREIAAQLLRAGFGTAGNYWSACRGRSDSEFIARLAIAADEAAESVLWLMLMIRSGMCDSLEAKSLLQEGREITAILSASHKTARENRRKRKARS